MRMLIQISVELKKNRVGEVRMDLKTGNFEIKKPESDVFNCLPANLVMCTSENNSMVQDF